MLDSEAPHLALLLWGFTKGGRSHTMLISVLGHYLEDSQEEDIQVFLDQAVRRRTISPLTFTAHCRFSLEDSDFLDYELYALLFAMLAFCDVDSRFHEVYTQFNDWPSLFIGAGLRQLCCGKHRFTWPVLQNVFEYILYVPPSLRYQACLLRSYPAEF